ncbi:Hsp70 family protein [Actinomycetes bacterium KLBMP 9797]
MAGDRTPSSGHALGIDFGTSHTVAVVRWPDGRARPLLIDGSPLLPSAVYAEPGGGHAEPSGGSAEPGGALAVGRDAVHSARLDPARFEPNPKRRIDEGTLLLGDREVPVVELIGAVFGRVAEEWARTVGPVRPQVTLTCPATWGATRRRLLADAAARAGFDGVRLVAEPVAAATYFAKVLGRDVPIGSVVVVHDFGAGTFDASVVARTSSGFEVLAVDGRDDIGGIDVDAAVIAHLRTAYLERDPGAWARLDAPTTVEERRAKRQLWDDVRVAKERLSRSPTADLVIPLLDVEAHLTRAELESLATPILAQTVEVTQGVMRWAKLAPGRVAGVFLVGGSSRIPLMATLLHRALGTAPEAIEQPELVVAEGSISAGETLLASAPPAPGPTMLLPRQVSPAAPPPGPGAGLASPASGSAAVAPLSGSGARPASGSASVVPPSGFGAGLVSPASGSASVAPLPASGAGPASGFASAPPSSSGARPAAASRASSAAPVIQPAVDPWASAGAPDVTADPWAAPAPPISPAPSPAPPAGSPAPPSVPNPARTPDRSVGRVTMPDAQLPGRSRQPLARQLKPTRTMPRFDEPEPGPSPGPASGRAPGPGAASRGPGSASRGPGSASRGPGSASRGPGSASRGPGSTSKSGQASASGSGRGSRSGRGSGSERGPAPEERPVRADEPRRRRGFLVRTFRTLFFLAVLVAVSGTAALLAFSIARGESPEATVRNVADYLFGVGIP